MKLLLTSPELFERSNVHSVGMVILAFKQLVRAHPRWQRRGACGSGAGGQAHGISAAGCPRRVRASPPAAPPHSPALPAPRAPTLTLHVCASPTPPTCRAGATITSQAASCPCTLASWPTGWPPQQPLAWEPNRPLHQGQA
jgi:hypothetical protein